MLSFIKLHVTNLMFVFVARFRKYLGSFAEEEVFLISFHYTQLLTLYLKLLVLAFQLQPFDAHCIRQTYMEDNIAESLF